MATPRPPADGACPRELRLAREAVRRFALDLAPYAVFTEAATGPFAWTAALALLAGAPRVLALARDTRFGTAAEAAAATRAAAAAAGGLDRLTIVADHARVGEADIVTNAGAVRPIDAGVVARMRPGAVVPLMWETWEFRHADVDLAACVARGIPVMGTVETHPDLDIFAYVGLLAVRLLLEAGVEVLRSRVVVVGGGVFGAQVAARLAANGAAPALVCPPGERRPEAAGWWAAPTLDAPAARAALAEADALVVVDHHAEGLLVGDGSPMPAAELRALRPDLRIAHVTGAVHAPSLRRAGFTLVPDAVPDRPRVMSVTTGHLGPRPVIDLHAAGLRVGQELAWARRRTADEASARALAARHPLCQDFAPEHLRRLLAEARAARAAARAAAPPPALPLSVRSPIAPPR